MDATADVQGRVRDGTWLCLLGGLELGRGGDVLTLAAPAQRLLALLALQGPLPRRRAAELLWPDADEEHGLACVRSALWRVQRAAAGTVDSGCGRLRISPVVEVDVERLQRVAALLLSGVPMELQDLPPLPAGEELLPGWDEDWVVGARERLHQRWLHAVEARARRLLQLGDPAAALDEALRALAADRFRESAHTLVVQAHLAEGNRVEGWRQVQRCRELFRGELGVEVSPVLLTLVELSGAG